MSQLVLAFCGLPSAWKFHAIMKLYHLLKWSGYGVDLISDVVVQGDQPLKIEGLRDYLAHEKTLQGDASIVIFDTVLFTEESRRVLQEEAFKKSSAIVFIDWRVASTENLSVLPLSTYLTGSKKEAFVSLLSPLLEKGRHVPSIRDAENLENSVTLTVNDLGNRHLTGRGMQDPIMQKIERFFFALQPSSSPPVLISRKMVTNGSAAGLAGVIENFRGKTASIFSSTEAWARPSYDLVRSITKHPKDANVRDAGSYILSCLDESPPSLNLVGLTEDEIQVVYAENKEIRASLKDQKLCTDLMTGDQVDRILMNAHERMSGNVFERKPSQLKQVDFWPLITDVEAKGKFPRLIICGDEAHTLLSGYFLS